SESESKSMIHLVLYSDQNEISTIEETSNISLHSFAYDQYINELNKYQQQLQQFIMNLNQISSITQTYLHYNYTSSQIYQNYLVHQRINSTPYITNQSITVSSPSTVNSNEFRQENNQLRILLIVIELILFCLIFYIHSSLNFFLFLFIIFILLYLYYSDYLSIQQRQQIQPINEQINIEQIQNSNHHQQQQFRQTEPVVENQITTRRLWLTAILTFFSSLIPERTQRI
ncbi:unnamed protein product, partial [Rotaria sp. Silwood1]